jgi:mannitol-specific phosphotransferase system IIBC component
MKNTSIVLLLGIAITTAVIVSFVVYEIIEQNENKRIMESVKKTREYIQSQKNQTGLEVDRRIPH